ncbi:MAG: GatB/YqeY domain-containing protein [Candidatus Andersenbacteria bacterium]|nr:GatB/YqeY domain-containing protein [Candidatus Andersenbacteria bacterium]MCK4591917.1 GatB/YqeY domain-containing protein [Candidatus Parcubacteria bacterium]
MNLRGKIKNDLKDAMKSGDNITRGVLRVLNSDFKNLEIDSKKELLDDDIVKIIKKNIKSHKDSIEQYKKGNREDLVIQEEKELKILEKYVPEQMSEDEIRKIVIDVISKSEAVGASDFGRVMGVVMKEVGNKADGGLVGRIVKEKLK